MQNRGVISFYRWLAHAYGGMSLPAKALGVRVVKSPADIGAAVKELLRA